MANAKPDACIGRRLGLRTDELAEDVDILRKWVLKVAEGPRSSFLILQRADNASKWRISLEIKFDSVYFQRPESGLRVASRGRSCREGI